MAVPFSQQVATTFDGVNNQGNRGADQFSDTSALNAIEELGGVKRQTGATPSATLDYRANSGAAFLLTDTTATSTAKTDVLTQTSPAWVPLVVPVNWSITDEEINSGPEQKVPLIASIVDNANTTHDFSIETAMFAATGGTNGMNTFVDLFTNDGTGTVQGIVSDTETWWKNKFKDWGTDTGATLLADYNTLYYSCSKGSMGKQPNIVIANSTLYGSFIAANQANQRFLDNKEARAGFRSAYLINARYIFSSVITTSQDFAVMFHTDDTYLAVLKSAFRKRRTPVEFTNALMMNMKVYSLVQLVTRNRSRGGKLFT